MYIVAIAWLYVILMMSVTERSVVAGIMNFLLYGVFPLAIILYVMGARRRKHARVNAEKMEHSSSMHSATGSMHDEAERDKRC